jgi:hypothetical protein
MNWSLNKKITSVSGLFLAMLLTAFDAMAAPPAGWDRPVVEKPISTERAGDCAPAGGKSFFDMDINNVRARLLSSGDVWWDQSNARYEVPKVQPGQKSVSSIFAGAVWIGGKDPAGNLKVAAQTYRSGTRNDFWPGPLRERDGTTKKDDCAKWDRHFVVTAAEIEEHLRYYRAARARGELQYDKSLIPNGLKGWPAYKNPYFFQIHSFDMEDRAISRARGWAKFHDEDQDGRYDPSKGDFPVIDVRGCEAEPIYPDQMVFWIYNDNGNAHTQSRGSIPIQMEVQVQAFSYKTNDELNDMTFQRYKLINRATQDIDSMFFAMWVDADLGCPDDDFIGCDTSRSLMYMYNADNEDGTVGCSCPVGGQQVPTYCQEIPIIGVDYFRGPRDVNGNELGMSSFTYYVRSDLAPFPGMGDPNTANEFYNLLIGKWKDGTAITPTGNGYNPGAPSVGLRYAFPAAPNRPGWNMCNAGAGRLDVRSLQATGPLKLVPGAINELIIGVPWVANQKYPCPDISRIQEADDIAQALFDNCFKLPNGPDAPDVTWVELDKEIVAVLTHDPVTSNNYNEKYAEKGLKIPAGERDSLYRFQGYVVYQLKDPNVPLADLNDRSKARIVAQVDAQDTVSKIYNWTTITDPNFPGQFVFSPREMITGENKGIRHTFRIDKDAFGVGAAKLVNHKKYYFTVISYAYNNYKPFQARATSSARGQQEPFFVGRRNIGSAIENKHFYTVTPRPITDVQLNSVYGGDNILVTRTDGVGNQSRFLDITDESLTKILNGTNNNEITYKGGAAPFDVKIYNPLEVKNGEYALTIRDGNMNDQVIDDTARWVLRRTDAPDAPVVSATTIQALNEQVMAQYGFSIGLAQVADAGTQPFTNKTNGAVGMRVEYEKGTAEWLGTIPNGIGILENPIGGNDITKYIKIGRNDPNSVFLRDPEASLTRMSNMFVPYYLCDYTNSTSETLLSPAWQDVNASNVHNEANNGLYNLNNVDIVFTADKSKWSRCVVVETASPRYLSDRANFNTEGGANMFDLRRAASVGKEADATDPNKAAPDGDGQGMGWFPGYAVDVETGERLNIFFGENSTFNPALPLTYDPGSKNCRDMIWNPSSQATIDGQGIQIPFQNIYMRWFFGGHHYVYVTNTKYDSCKLYRDRLTGSAFRKITALRTLTWAMPLPITAQGRLKSYKDGIIPGETKVKLRVDNSFAVRTGAGANNGYPTYKFSLKGVEKAPLTPTGVDSALSMINVVPNPYYGGSAYEATEFLQVMKITNVPALCTITISSIDGKFIRQYKRDEKPLNNKSNTGVPTKQIGVHQDWDLKNAQGIPVASGVYLIHIDAPGVGQRTVKAMIVNREFDPSRY